MNEITAINIMLLGSRYEPVSDLDSQDLPLSAALPVLRNVTKRFISVGYNFNTHQLTLTPDVNDRIAIPSTHLKYQLPGEYEGILVNYGGYLWNRETQTYHDEAITVLAVLDIDFDSLPEPFAEWIAREAAAEFGEDDGVSPERMRNLRERAYRAKADALNSEISTFNSSTWTNVYGAFIR